LILFLQDKEGLDKLAAQRNARLLKITIHKSGIVDILDDLETLGIVEITVCPDLGGLSRELIRARGG